MYLISAPNRVRPGQTVQVSVNIMSVHAGEVTVRAAIRRDTEQIAAAIDTYYHPTLAVMSLQVVL